MKRIGILAHSAEGAALCFLTAVHEGERRLGAHLHPEILMDATAMGDSMDDWARLDFPPIRARFAAAIERLKGGGADFWLCPDNTAHLALEAEGEPLALPGLHIHSVVAAEAKRRGFKRVGITGTLWTMEGPIYPREFAAAGIDSLTPPPQDRADIQAIIFDELVRGVVNDRSRARFTAAVQSLKDRGCDSVVLGCTELPLILDDTTSPVPTLASTQLLAIAAVDVALGEAPMPTWRGGPR
ncbi:MAG TPA: amino acid racemase [Caulobacteraceae bacterium]|jgi:aspartate racemase